MKAAGSDGNARELSDRRFRPRGMRADPLCRLIGRSQAMQSLRRMLADAAATPSTVLLSGETGTGKGLAARTLHAASPRSKSPFVHVDCASLSSSLIESELFGHERGAFTGATERRAGRFELAAGGTLFLDEIGELAAPLQAKLLRVLQDRVFERIGGSRTLRMSARIVAASNRELAKAVRRRRFRADLYYRLKVVHIRVPALRDRRDDLPLLVESTLDDLCKRLAVARPRLSVGFLDRLSTHSWPGNVRELENLIERMLVTGSPSWGGDDLALLLGDVGEQLELGGCDEDGRERARVATVLAAHAGNVARAARALNLPRSTLRYRIAKYGLADPVDFPTDV